MNFKQTAAKIAAAVPELASRQKIDLDPPAAPEPLRAGWAAPLDSEPIAQIEFQRALAKSAYTTGPSAEQVAEAQRRDNAIAAAWMAQRAGQ